MLRPKRYAGRSNIGMKILTPIRQVMQFPISIRVLSDTLADKTVLSDHSTILSSILQPIHDVLQNRQLALVAKLRQLGALELEYAKTIERMCRDWTWKPFKVSSDFDGISNYSLCSDILETRRWFSEEVGDVVKVSASFLCVK